MSSEVITGYDGQMVMTRHDDPISAAPRLTIDQADPRIRVAAEVMTDIEREGGPWCTFDGQLLKIAASNRTVIYRVDGFDRARDQYLMSWPD